MAKNHINERHSSVGGYSATGLLNLIYSGLTDFLSLVNETLFNEP